MVGRAGVQACAGIIADGKHIANRAREEAQNFRDTYDEPVAVKVRIGPSSVSHFHAEDHLILSPDSHGTSRSLHPRLHLLRLRPTIRSIHHPRRRRQVWTSTIRGGAFRQLFWL